MFKKPTNPSKSAFTPTLLELFIGMTVIKHPTRPSKKFLCARGNYGVQCSIVVSSRILSRGAVRSNMKQGKQTLLRNVRITTNLS